MCSPGLVNMAHLLVRYNCASSTCAALGSVSGAEPGLCGIRALWLNTHRSGAGVPDAHLDVSQRSTIEVVAARTAMAMAGSRHLLQELLLQDESFPFQLVLLLLSLETPSR